MATDIHQLFHSWGRFGLYTFFIDAPEPAIVDTGVTGTPNEGIGPGLGDLGKDIADVKWILLTHGHVDHMGGAYALWEATGRKAKVVIHEADLKYIESRRSHVDNYMNLRDKYIDNPNAEAEQAQMAEHAISGEMSADVILKGGETLDLGGGVTVSVVNVPGHTEGSVAYVVDGQNDVFVGDAVQIHGAANGFPGYEDPDAYRASLETLRELAPERMYIGHPYRSAAGEEYPIIQEAGTAMRAIEESLEIEARIREVAQRAITQGLTTNDSSYSPFAAAAEELGYDKDPTLEPSPFFTTMDGYRTMFER